MKYLICFVVLLLHFTFGYPVGFALTIGFIGASALALSLVSEHSVKRVALAWVIIVSITIAQLVLLPQRELDSFEYTKTFLLILYNVTLWVLACYGGIRLRLNSYVSAIELSLCAVCGLTFAQFALFKFGNTPILFGLLGKFAYFGINHDPITQGAVRAYAMYLEPSYCALVMVALFTCLAISNKLKLWHYIIFAMGAFATSSLSGLLAGAILISVVWVYKLNLSRSFRIATVVASILVAALILVYVSSSSEGSYLNVRMAESSVEGSSSYYRFVAPMIVVKDVLANFPLGRGLGNVERVVTGFQLAHAGRFGQSIDNAYYLIVFYYGWIGLIGIGYLWYMSAKTFLSGNKETFFILLFVCISLNFTGGGVVNAEYGLLLSLIIITRRLKVSEARPNPQNASPKVGLRKNLNLKAA